MIELRQQLEKERSVRMMLEDQVSETARNSYFKSLKLYVQTNLVTRIVSTHNLHFYLPLCLSDALTGCTVVPRETEGNCPAGPGAAGPNSEPCSSAAAQAAGEGPHSSPQPTGWKRLHINLTHTYTVESY